MEQTLLSALSFWAVGYTGGYVLSGKSGLFRGLIQALRDLGGWHDTDRDEPNFLGRVLECWPCSGWWAAVFVVPASAAVVDTKTALMGAVIGTALLIYSVEK